MAEGSISTIEDVKKYYERCLAKFQGTAISDLILSDLMKVLTEQRAIKVVDGKYVVTNLGKIASWLYFSPFDICDWWKNFSSLFNGGGVNYEQMSDADIAVAWASTRSNQLSYIPKDIGEGCDELRRRIRKLYLKDTAAAASTALYLKLNGTEIKDVPSSLIPMYRGLSFDVERHAQAILLINAMYGCWNQDKTIKMIATRIAYGVGWKQAELCLLPKIGKARSTKLVEHGIVTLRDFIDKKNTAKEIVGEAIYTVALEKALELTGRVGKVKV
jgi:replicative superfamily II helicase